MGQNGEGYRHATWGGYSGNVHLITALGTITSRGQPFYPISVDYMFYKFNKFDGKEKYHCIFVIISQYFDGKQLLHKNSFV